MTAIASGAESVGVVNNGAGIYPGSYTLDLRNSIAAGDGADLFASNGVEGPGNNIVVANSNFDKPKEEGGKLTDAGGNQSAAPLFVDAAAGDYREAPGSPTIDAGAADPLIGPLDLAGAAPGPGGRARHRRFRGAGSPAAPSTRRRDPISGGLAQGLRGRERRRRDRQLQEEERAGRRDRDLRPSGGGANGLHRRAQDDRPTGGKKCVKRTKANRAAGKCPLFRPVKGSFTRAGPAGLNQFMFSGRANGKALKPGPYRLVGSAGGVVKWASFRIVK